MVVNGWKLTAIIFICLFLLETSFIVYIISIGNKEINNEVECSNVICYNKGYDAFTYENGLCNCWKGNEIVYQEILK
jgi:hypothetical protein